MRILVTGFEPFGSHASNPSQEIVTALAARASAAVGRPFQLHTTVLPTEYDRAASRITLLIAELSPDAIVCLGVAGKADGICLERIALNLNDAELADNAGEIRTAQPIIPGAPMAYLSTLPLAAMLQELRGARFPTSISNHAGTYVCNHVFYTARHTIEQKRATTPCGFIHVPVVDDGKGLTVLQLTDAIEVILQVMARHRGASD
jgi:pyroglutamyl-peptidase